MRTSIRARIPLLATTFLLLAMVVSSYAQILSDAAMSGDPDAMWSEGRLLARRGERLIEKGEKHMAAGRRDLREGEERIRAGNQAVVNSRRDYEAAVARAGEATTTRSAAAEASRLREVGKRWERAIVEIRAGNEQVEKGNRKIDAGQAEILEGRKMVEIGSLLMRNSERQRRGMELLPTEVDTDSPMRR